MFSIFDPCTQNFVSFRKPNCEWRPLSIWDQNSSCYRTFTPPDSCRGSVRLVTKCTLQRKETTELNITIKVFSADLHYIPYTKTFLWDIYYLWSNSPYFCRVFTEVDFPFALSTAFSNSLYKFLLNYHFWMQAVVL
jgi:hypothetical protein